MSSSSAITRPEDPNYLFEIHRQTMQLCDAFSVFQYQTERQFDAVFTEFRKVNERIDKLEIRMDSIERTVDGLVGHMGSLEGKVDQLDGRMSCLETDNAEIKSTLQQILEKLS